MNPAHLFLKNHCQFNFTVDTFIYDPALVYMRQKMSKNECNKTRDIDNPYEIWKGPANFEWRVLKKYQSPENEAKNEYARWFCAVKSDMTYGSFELGDTYVSDIKAYGTKVK